MASRRVLSVGQCDYDHGNISRMLQTSFGSEVVRAHSAPEAIRQLRDGKFDLVLVNRVFDADGDSGLDLIQKVKSDEALRAVPVMLVSNLEDAQEQATAAGAVPGFGKAALSAAATQERLGQILGG